MKRGTDRFIWILMLAALAAPAIARADEKEGLVKAALLFQFAKLTNFPPAAFSSADAPMAIDLLGDVEFKDTLIKGVTGKKVGTHPVVVKVISSPAEAAGCQVLYIAPGQDAAAAIAAVAGQPMVTVAEGDTFLAAGGVMRFLVDENKVRFQINVPNGEKAGLKFQLKLLNVAKF